MMRTDNELCRLDVTTRNGTVVHSTTVMAANAKAIEVEAGRKTEELYGMYPSDKYMVFRNFIRKLNQ